MPRRNHRRHKKEGRPCIEDQREVFNDVYRRIFAIDLHWEAKYAGMERILYDSKWIDHWVPVGITRDALKCLSDEGFPSRSKSVVRGHISSRRERAALLLDRQEPFPDAFDRFIDMDRVVIVTKAENAGDRTLETWSAVIDIPDTTFDYVEGYGLNFRGARELLTDLALRHGLQDQKQ